MTIAYLNGDYMPLEEARISPMDRGFLFGDGIYEVIPSYGGKMVGFGPHIKRMQDGLAAIEINLDWDDEKWRRSVYFATGKKWQWQSWSLSSRNPWCRDSKRHHAYPEGIEPTVFGYAFEILHLRSRIANKLYLTPAPPVMTCAGIVAISNRFRCWVTSCTINRVTARATAKFCSTTKITN